MPKPGQHGCPEIAPESPYHERMVRFNDTTGTHGYISKLGRTGAHLHPDRCRCQRRDTTPHKHYDDGGCARCLECKSYVPYDEARKLELREDARKIVVEASRGS